VPRVSRPPTGALAFSTSHGRLVQGLRPVMAGCRILARLAPDASERSGIDSVTDVDHQDTDRMGASVS